MPILAEFVYDFTVFCGKFYNWISPNIACFGRLIVWIAGRSAAEELQNKA
ncbi:hypothetical protein [Sphingomonas sp.]